MASIPISQIVQVNPGVLSAAGSAVDLNGLFVTKNTYVPIGAVQQFASATDVGTYFGTASAEYAAAQIYFNGPNNATKLPGKCYFAQYPAIAVSAYLRSASLAGMTLTQLQALSGTLIITVDGVVKTSSTINLATATSFSNAATIIAAAFTSGPTVAWDAIKSAFIITSTTTGTASTMTYATGTLSTSLMLTAATSAVLSQGAAATTPSVFMDSVKATQLNWASFTTLWEPVTADKQAFSLWSSNNPYRFLYVGYDSDPNAKVAGNTTTWGYYLQSNSISGSCPIFGDITHAAFVMGCGASLDFSRLNGRNNIAFDYQSGLVASVTNASDASALQTNGYNWYGSYANSTTTWNFIYPGSVSGSFLWWDSYMNQIWLNANLQLAMVNLLLSVGNIPYNEQGYNLVNAACQDPINSAVNFGAIRTGVNLSTSQKAQIQYALGVDASPAIYAKGFYLQISDASAATRVARQSPPMTLYYADGQSIQQLTLASIEVA